jgi:RNA polymerase sigma-70 factor, ECF subfamily
MQLVGNSVDNKALLVSVSCLKPTVALGPAQRRVRSRLDRTAWSDDTLLAHMLQGEDAAWEEFLRRYRKLIMSCIDRVSGPFMRTTANADREDIYAQLLYALNENDMHRLRAFRSDRGVRLGTWIGVLTRNLTWDFLRRLPRRHQSDALAQHLGSSECTEDPEHILERKETLKTTNDLFTRLSEKDQRFVQLFYVDMLSPESIASAMNISVKTVYSKKHKLQNRLHQLMQCEAERRPVHLV